MGVNKVIYSGQTLIDLTEDTVTPEDLAEGITAHNAAGERITGTGAAVDSPYKGKTVLVAGDSIMAGWGWEEGKGITEPFKEWYPDATWLNIAESGANMAVTSRPEHTPIVTQIRSYTGAADVIIFDGGVNDKNSGISMGAITSGYDAEYDTGTFCGAMESSLQYIMDRYPLAIKLYVIPHSFAKNNAYLDDIYSKAIEICEKWNMPYIDMRKYAQIAMTAANKAKYTHNPNTGEGDGVHLVEVWYRTFYCPIIDQQLQLLGVAYTEASEAPEVVAVTGVSLSSEKLSIKEGETVVLTATVKPSNATNKAVKWSTDNSNVTVQNGSVTGKTAGSSIVTVTTEDGGYAVTCEITITASATDYTELESITLDGSCYFDTEIFPDQNTNTEAKYYIQTGSTYIAGARDDNYKYGYTCTDNIYVVRGTVSSAAQAAAFWQDTWIIKQNGMSAAVNSTTLGLDATEDFTLTSPFYIGNMSKNGSPAGAGLKGKVYYAKIYAGTELVADMIPVKKADGTLCLYDKTRKKYIYKSGSGTVTQ